MVTSDRGDVVELLDANGERFAAYRYDPWGQPQGNGNYKTGIWTYTDTNSLIDSTTAGQIADRQVLRYAGYVYDADSGLYYCQARYYDPATEQWLSPDLAKADGEESAYQYCGGDPVNHVDPSGTWSLVTTIKHAAKWVKEKLEALWNWANKPFWDPWVTVKTWTWSADKVRKLCHRLDTAGTTIDSAEQAGIASIIGDFPAALLGLVSGGCDDIEQAYEGAMGDNTHHGHPDASVVTKLQTVVAVLWRLNVAGHVV